MLSRLSRRSIITTTAAAGVLALLAAAPRAAHAAAMSFSVPLSGAQQVPPVKTAGHGSAHLIFNPANDMLTWDVTYAGLSSPVTMAHIHTGAAGKNGGVDIWLSKKGHPVAGPIKGSAKLTAAQAKMMMAGDLYINLHTKKHPAGEIRGQIVPPKG